MGRTLPTASMLLRIEREEWKPFHDALDKKDRKIFDDMFDRTQQFNYAVMCAMPSIVVPFRLVAVSVLFGNYKALKKLETSLNGPPSP